MQPDQPRDRGICGEAAPIMMHSPLGGICTLLAGHDGWHAADDGMTWGYRTPPLRAWQPDVPVDDALAAAERRGYERGLAEGRRQVIEAVAGRIGVTVDAVHPDERLGFLTFSELQRLVGPWEPAEQPEAEEARNV